MLTKSTCEAVITYIKKQKIQTVVCVCVGGGVLCGCKYKIYYMTPGSTFVYMYKKLIFRMNLRKRLNQDKLIQIHSVSSDIYSV